MPKNIQSKLSSILWISGNSEEKMRRRKNLEKIDTELYKSSVHGVGGCPWFLFIFLGLILINV